MTVPLSFSTPVGPPAPAAGSAGSSGAGADGFADLVQQLLGGAPSADGATPGASGLPGRPSPAPAAGEVAVEEPDTGDTTEVEQPDADTVDGATTWWAALPALPIAVTTPVPAGAPGAVAGTDAPEPTAASTTPTTSVSPEVQDGTPGAAPEGVAPAASGDGSTDAAPGGTTAGSTSGSTSAATDGSTSGSTSGSTDGSTDGSTGGDPTGTGSAGPGSTPAPAAPGVTAPGPGVPDAALSAIAGTTPAAAPAPTTTAAAPASPTGPVTRQVFPEVVRVAQSGGTQRVTVRLQPEALGEVRVVLTTHRGQLRVSLAAEGDAHRALIEGTPELRRLLEAVGGTDARIVVRDLPGNQSGTQAGQPGGQYGARQDGLGDPGGSTSADPGDGRPGEDRSDPTNGRTTATDGTTDATNPSRRTESVTGGRSAGLDVTM